MPTVISPRPVATPTRQIFAIGRHLVHGRLVYQRIRQIDNTVIRLVGKAEIFRWSCARSRIWRDGVNAAHRFTKLPPQVTLKFIDRSLDAIENLVGNVAERLSGSLEHQVALLSHFAAQSRNLPLHLRAKLVN